MTNATIGTRIYNRGDMANEAHFGTITRIDGFYVEITPENDRKPYMVPAPMISAVDKGNGSTRIVTEAAHRAYHEQQLATLNEFVARMQAQRAAR